jgi:predicted RNA methylase
MDWDPTSPQAWAQVLGLVHVPMFGNRPHAPERGEHAVLLDGRRASFAISATDSSDTRYDDEPLSWTWSANVHHLLSIDVAKREMFLRRWDAPGQMRHFRLPKHGRGAQELLSVIEAAPAPRSADVILHLLKAFRQIRAFFNSPIDAIYVLNMFLLGTESVRFEPIRKPDWLGCRTVRDAISFLTPDQIADSGADKLSADALNRNIASLTSFFVSSEPVTGCHLEPDILLRHAASQLYQEAHLQLERDPQLSLLFGLADDGTPRGHLERDVRFTPSNLARTLVQQALKIYDHRASIDVLDPACGSGVFLQETLRELAATNFNGNVHVRGIDRSDISCAIANFCMQRAKKDLGPNRMTVESTITKGDALAVQWGTPNIVLMNPPFVAWDQMGSTDQSRVRAILGDAASGRIDKAMAFLCKAVDEVSLGGVIATVLPSPLLENKSGEPLRARIDQTATLRAVGRFDGMGYFAGSMVETSFVVLERSTDPAPIRVVLAQENFEGAALRAMRLNESDVATVGVELFYVDRASFVDRSWAPRTAQATKIIAALAAASVPLVGKLFDVKQGALTGHNEAFVISMKEYESLPVSERSYFRLAAGNSTIKHGRIEASEYVFYPYNAAGLTITTEGDLRKKLPKFYARNLEQNKAPLQARPRVGEQWWRLAEARAWQRVASPKLVSTYFGDSGSFAYDEDSEFVVLQGYGWLWKRQSPVVDVTGDEDDADVSASISFHETHLPMAYLALLNSDVFELVLGCLCPRVQGGQFNLSKRFVENVPLPDLSDERRVRPSLVRELAKVGRCIQKGKEYDEKDLSNLVASSYGIPSSMFGH